jgi:Zincin-like metallopeptidase
VGAEAARAAGAGAGRSGAGLSLKAPAEVSRDVLRAGHVVTKSEAWASLQAPTLADLERLAEEAFARLPARFRRLCDGVVVRLEEFPDDETLREMGFESPFDLLGLFRGIGLAQDGACRGAS